MVSNRLVETKGETKGQLCLQATLLTGNGTDVKTVQHRLGHSSASLTMNIYAHAIEQNDREAADAISGILNRKTE